ncbi:Sucrase/ferredoxin-like-domain-containing protein [Parasitella parasitica]|nr:Sucrase/ferredoxin-like-domain-containing protein [Parasitella parasitica]
MLRTTTTLLRKPGILRCYSTNPIPFDENPFPFSRFEPCCPDTEAKQAENGYIPCKSHPFPKVLGRKIDMTDPMTRPAGIRHLVGCVGADAMEWTRAKVEAIPGIMQSLMTTENQWLKENRPQVPSDKVVMATVAERPGKCHRPDVMLFPEFKIFQDISSTDGVIDSESPLYNALKSIWQNPYVSLPPQKEWLDIEADTVVFVCTHARRDLRCGKLGPLIVNEFNRVIQEKQLQGKVEVWGTSHFGGKVQCICCKRGIYTLILSI